jgi:hypothetical protein
MKKLWSISIFLTASLLYSCHDKVENESTHDRFFYIYNRGGTPVDTMNFTVGFEKLQDNCSLIYAGSFKFRNTDHDLKLFLHDNPTAQDEEQLLYVLDSLGIFYSHSLVWRSHSALWTTNDSLNQLMTAAKNHILADPSFHCFQCNPPTKSKKDN